MNNIKSVLAHTNENEIAFDDTECLSISIASDSLTFTIEATDHIIEKLFTDIISSVKTIECIITANDVDRLITYDVNLHRYEYRTLDELIEVKFAIKTIRK